MAGMKDYLRGNWNQIKGKLKENYGELTDDDLMYQEGKEDQLIGRLQEKLGKSKSDIENMLMNMDRKR